MKVLKWFLGMAISVCMNHNLVCAEKKPNILLLIVDDLRPALGCYDYPKVLSPNIDQLAASSVRFNNAHVQQTVCGPSRTSFLTSRRPDTTRLYDFGFYWRDHAGNYTSLPQHFKNNGYFTYSIGKVFHPGICSNHNDDYPYSWSEPAFHPSTQKYKMSKVCPGPGGKKYVNLLCAVDVETQPEKTLPDIQSSDHAVDILKTFNQNASQPFFLAVGFHKPHIPYKFPKEYLDLYPIDEISLASNPFIPPDLPDVAFSPWPRLQVRDDFRQLNVSFPFGPIPINFQKKIRQHYYSSVSYTDTMIGKVLDQLEKSGFADNTIIALMGDHGWSLGEHGEWCKYENFEVVTRVPLMIHVPGVTDQNRFQEHKFKFKNVFNKYKNRDSYSVNKGLNADALVEAVDLFPTLSELGGIEVPPMCPESSFKTDFCTEGLSFAPVIHHSASNYRDRKIKFSPNGDGGDSAPDDNDLNWKDAVFSQYPRPSDFPQINSDLPSLKDIKIMGYTMRTHHHRYTEWVQFNPTTFYADFSQVHARELYLRDSDPLEIYNVADYVQYKDIVEDLSLKLKLGWKNALPK